MQVYFNSLMKWDDYQVVYFISYLYYLCQAHHSTACALHKSLHFLVLFCEFIGAFHCVLPLDCEIIFVDVTGMRQKLKDEMCEPFDYEECFEHPRGLSDMSELGKYYILNI